MINKATAATLFVSVLALVVLTLDVVFWDGEPEEEAYQRALAPYERIMGTDYGQALIELKAEAVRHPEKVATRLSELKTQQLLTDDWPYLAFEHLVLFTGALYQENRIQQQKQKMLMLELVPVGERPQYEMAALLELSVKQARKSENEQGIQSVVQAIALGEKHNSDMQLLRAYNTAGVLHNSANQLNKAQWYFYKGIELGQRYPDNSYSSKLYNNLAQLYVHLEQWQPALDNLNMAEERYRSRGEFETITMQTALLNKSFIYSKLENIEKAREAYQASLQYVSGDVSDYPYLLEYKSEARLLWMEKQYPAALDAVERCVNHPKALVYKKQKGQCLLIKANILSEQGEVAESLKTIEYSLTLFDQVKHSRMLLKTYLLQAENYEKIGKISKALEVYKHYYQNEKEQLLIQVYALEHAFELRKVEQQRDLLDVQNHLNALQLERGQLRLKVASIWILIILFVLGFVLHRAFAVKSRNLELEHLSNVDPLTGLNNRRYYHQELKQGGEIDLHAYYRLVLIDLDHFKSINDNYGHDCGDQVLVETAARLGSLMQEEELFVRWGGEEFLCLLKDTDDLRERVKEMVACIHQLPYETREGELRVTISVGVSDASSADDLRHNTDVFADADQRLYDAKRGGRNRAVFG